MAENRETVVRAAKKVGKDFVAGFICLWFFLAHRNVRVITTIVKDDHLRVLWGEIGRFIQTSRVPLTFEQGGPLVVNHREIRKMVDGGRTKCPISYLMGMVSERGEGMSGHHAANTLLVIDEASGVDDMVYLAGSGWAGKMLIFGNPNPTENFFRRINDGGDIL